MNFNPEKFSKNEKEQPVLTFEEFSSPGRGSPFRCNNFYLKFYLDMVDGELHPYIKKMQEFEAFQKFMAQDNELYNTICNKITEPLKKDRTARTQVTQDTLPELYEAYKKLRSYGANDEDLIL